MKAINKKILIERKTEIEAMRERLEEIKNEFEDIQSDEQEVFDGRSEKWQESEKGEAFQNQLDEIGNVMNALDDSYSGVEEAFVNMESLLETVSNS